MRQKNSHFLIFFDFLETPAGLPDFLLFDFEETFDFLFDFLEFDYLFAASSFFDAPLFLLPDFLDGEFFEF